GGRLAPSPAPVMLIKRLCFSAVCVHCVAQWTHKYWRWKMRAECRRDAVYTITGEYAKQRGRLNEAATAMASFGCLISELINDIRLPVQLQCKQVTLTFGSEAQQECAQG